MIDLANGKTLGFSGEHDVEYIDVVSGIGRFRIGSPIYY